MIKVAVLGYGNIGSGVVQVLLKNKETIAKKAGDEIVPACVLDLRDFPGDVMEDKVVKDINLITQNPEISIVVETMGGTKPAYSFVKACLEAGKHVATSNKELVAAHGPELLEIAKDFFGGRCEKNCSHHSKVVFNMLELFAKRTDENNQQLEVLTSGNLKQRIATYLLEHADNNNLVSLSMNREELALYLNTTRPSLSRTLLSLQEDGFIHLSSRKSIKILDAEALLYIE